MTRFSRSWLLVLAAMTLLVSAAAPTRVPPSSLQPSVGLGYRPVDIDEKGMWQGFDRLEEEVASSNLRVRDPALQAYVEGVLSRLLGPQAGDLRVYILRDPGFNASMAPNGMTIVQTGLLARMRDEAELAAVLGHEAGHYLLRHSVASWRDMKKKTGVMAFVSVGSMFAAGAVAMAGGDGRSWIDLANSINNGLVLSLFSFSREHESEADAYGLKLLAAAGYLPQAAPAIWRQFIAERRASAAARGKAYRDLSRSIFSTHPPSSERLADLDASAGEIEMSAGGRKGDDRRAQWMAAIGSIEPSLLDEQIKLNDPGASLFLVRALAADGWTGPLRFYEGEVYRLRDTKGDEALADAAYAAAVAAPDAPPEAWRQHGYALLKLGGKARAVMRCDTISRLNLLLPMRPWFVSLWYPRGAVNMLKTPARRPWWAMTVLLAGCAPHYTLVSPGTVSIAHSSMRVSPGMAWNAAPHGAYDIKWEENWTENGPLLDSIGFVVGLPDGQAIVRQRSKQDRQVPIFHATMSPQDLVSMLESAYRIKAGAKLFETAGVEPLTFLGHQALGVSYTYVAEDEVKRRGRAVVAIVDGKLYMMTFDGAALHYFDAAFPDFQRMVTNATMH